MEHFRIEWPNKNSRPRSGKHGGFEVLSLSRWGEYTTPLQEQIYVSLPEFVDKKLTWRERLQAMGWPKTKKVPNPIFETLRPGEYLTNGNIIYAREVDIEKLKRVEKEISKELAETVDNLIIGGGWLR